MTSCDVLIIGAGLSALQAARTLQTSSPESSRKIVLLEARNRVGGRAFTHSYALDAHVDLGCSMIHGYYEGNPARGLLRELEMDVHIPEGAKGLVYGDEGPLTEADSTSLFATSTQMAFKPSPDTTPADKSVADLLFPTLKEKDERLIAIARTGEIGAGVELERTSAKWTGFEKGVGGTDAFPEGGYSEVIKNLVADFKSQGGQLELEQQVVSLKDLSTEKGVEVTTRSGSTFTAKYVISTIPLAVLQKDPPTFEPPLSKTFQSAVERTLVGNLEKIVLQYSEPWWPSPETNGSFLLLPLSTSPYSPSESATAPPPKTLEELFERTTIPIVNFYRIGSTPHPTLLAYIGATAARHLSNFSSSEISSSLHRYLVRRLSSPNAQSVSEPISFVVTTWTSDPYSLGATSTPTTLLTSADGTHASPLDFVVLSRAEWDGRLGWAGEHTDLDNHGSVCGALVSGKREGERVGLLLEAEERKRGK
ncbi:flavin monoamine oxidase family protein [Sporobolomyces salmoneus]|uniref:flavin monoamine oxidase family protein n=1 Tax=Sporobolomyces salmoneus TaxID=183962 RepID=UPI003178E60F